MSSGSTWRAGEQGSSRGRSVTPCTAPGSGQYADLGPHRGICFGNLDRCPHGVTFATWLRTGKYKTDSMEHYIHTGDNGIDIWYEDRKLHCTFKTSSKVWELDYEALEPEQWYQIEYSWHPAKGLSLYINDERVKTVKTSRARAKFDLETSSRRHNSVYFGRGVGNSGSDYSTANMTVDQMEYWVWRPRLFDSVWVHQQRYTLV